LSTVSTKVSFSTRGSSVASSATKDSSSAGFFSITTDSSVFFLFAARSQLLLTAVTSPASHQFHSFYQDFSSFIPTKNKFKTSN
jgi:hypothetical protein